MENKDDQNKNPPETAEPDELLSGDDMRNYKIHLTSEKKENEEEGEDGKAGESGGGQKILNKLNPQRLLELIKKEYSDKAWLEKIKKLDLAPFSVIIPGASAFDAESDLKKKLLMGQAGIIKGTAEPKDIADPDFVKKQESRLDNILEELKRIRDKIEPMALKVGQALGGLMNVAMGSKHKSGGIKTPKNKSKLLQALEKLASKFTSTSRDFYSSADPYLADYAQKSQNASPLQAQFASAVFNQSPVSVLHLNARAAQDVSRSITTKLEKN